MNLIEFPFATLSRQPAMGSIKCKRWLTAPTGRRYQQSWVVQGGSESGLPTEFDERVYVALMAITHRHGFADRKVPFSVYQLLKIMGESTDNRHYGSVERSLERLMRASIMAEGAFWDKEKREVVGMLSGFHLIDRFWLAYKERDRRVVEKEGTRGYVVWGEELWRSFQVGYLKQMDLGVFFSLATPVARRLYRFLNKKLYRCGRYEIDIFQLAEQLGMARYHYPTKVLEKLKPGVQELKATGLLASVSIVKVKGYTRIRFIKGRLRVSVRIIDAPRHKDATVPPRQWRDEVARERGLSDEQRKLWEGVLAQVEGKTSRATFGTWVARTQLLELGGDTALIGLPNEYAKTLIDSRMRDDMQTALGAALDRRILLRFRVLRR